MDDFGKLRLGVAGVLPGRGKCVACATRRENRKQGVLWLAFAASRAVSRSDIVHFDAPQSVAAAYSPAELKQICDEAGLQDAEVKPHWPCRMFVSWGVKCA